MGRTKQLGAIGILFTMLSGLISFVFNHFFIDYPSLKAAVNVIDVKQEKEIQLLDEIRMDIRQIRDQQNTVLKILAR
jgi:hypothetical protein